MSLFQSDLFVGFLKLSEFSEIFCFVWSFSISVISVQDLLLSRQILLVLLTRLDWGCLMETLKEGNLRAHGLLVRGKGPGYYPGRNLRPNLGL